MKHLPGLLIMLLVLMSPCATWAEEAPAGDSEESSKQTKSGSESKGGSGAEEEEPDCE